MPDISKQLKDAVKRSKRTFYELGKSSGVAQEQIARFVRGERDLLLSSAAKLADELGLQLGRKE